MDYCVKAGLKAPEFIEDEDFKVIIWRKEKEHTVDEKKHTVDDKEHTVDEKKLII